MFVEKEAPTFAKIDKKKEVVELIKKNFVEYEFEVGDLRVEISKQSMGKRKSETPTPQVKNKT